MQWKSFFFKLQIHETQHPNIHTHTKTQPSLRKKSISARVTAN